MAKEVKQAVLKTLAYSDIFDYPLTFGELWKFLIGEKIGKEQLKKELSKLSSKITQKGGFYCFAKREHIIKKRKKREAISNHKARIVKKIISFLRFIPTVQLIGVSGALAMKNAKENDDIDLFVIAQRNRLWTTRLLLLVFLELLGVRRKRDERATADRVCLNMLVDESFLCLPKDKQDLYSAHEVVQMLPVFERDNTYKRFIQANLWVREFLPNSVRRGTTRNTTRNYAESYFSVFLRSVLFGSAMEFLAKKAQLWYMRKHQTTEVISDSMLAFHPFNYREKILKEYNKRLEQYRL